MKILIAVDGSAYTTRMLEFLAAHGWLTPSNQYTVFHAAMRLPHRAAAFAGPDLTENYYRSDADSVLDPVRKFMAAHRVEAAFEYKVGHIAQTIAARAKEGGFDLLIMGSHGHGALANLVLGSVATQTIASCSTPVLIVR